MNRTADPIQRSDRPAQTSRRRSGFTLVEILIVVVILGVLAAMVVPQFSNAAEAARDNTLREDLRYMRTQVLVYTAQHDGTPPGYPGGDTSAAAMEAAFVDQLTSPTDQAGNVGAESSDVFKLGPYLRGMPENPVNALRTVRVIGPGAFPATADGTHGWIYQPSTVAFAADAAGADDDGTDYIDY